MRGGRGDLQNSWEVGGMICKCAFANHSSQLSAPLDQHHVTQIEVWFHLRFRFELHIFVFFLLSPGASIISHDHTRQFSEGNVESV
jgi:hypothetical protein